jgi:hypothetical protein
MSLTIGVDPGLTGAVALLGSSWAKVLDLPTKRDEVLGRRIDAPALAKLLHENVPDGEDDIRICIEALAAGGVDKGRNQFATVGSQHWTQSALVNTFELLGLQVNEYVYPVTWKRLYGLNGKKAEGNAAMQARLIAANLYPDLADDLSRAKDHNRAEAVLIGNWYRKCRL